MTTQQALHSHLLQYIQQTLNQAPYDLCSPYNLYYYSNEFNGAIEITICDHHDHHKITYMLLRPEHIELIKYEIHAIVQQLTWEDPDLITKIESWINQWIQSPTK